MITISEKTQRGETFYDVYSRLAKDRILFLSPAYGKTSIDGEVATTLTAALLFLDMQNSKKEIQIFINSPGGTVANGLFTIYDTMQYIKSPIKTVCIGQAYSAASLILGAGTKGKRKAYENAEIMIHEVQAGFSGSAAEIERESKRIKRLNAKLIKILSQQTNKSEEEILQMCKDETFLSAQEALEIGLIDEVIEPHSFKDIDLKK